jgi:hypothetical protein
LVVVVAVLGPAQAGAVEPHDARADGKDDPWTLCARHAAEIEIEEDLPPHLLSAISKVESGRWRAAEKTVRAWPWTVTWDGKGRFFATKAEALKTVRALRSSGRRSIDVGCMQVNLYYHPNAFEDLHTALDPARNIAYAAELLQRLRKEARSWPNAIAYYHSRKSRFNDPYRRKVFRAWHEEWLQAGLAPPAATTNMASQLATLAGLNAAAPNMANSLGQVQLGAFRKPENAHSVWFKLRQENAALLGGLQPRIDVVSRGQSGSLHFLRLGPVMTLKHARSICSKLLDRAIDCLVVEPPRRLALDGAIRHFR